MKRNVFLALVLFVASMSLSAAAPSYQLNSQSEKNEGYYHVQIMQSDVFMGGKSTLKIDAGDTPESALPKMTDEEGNELKFKNIVSALNYFSESGFEIVNTYVLNKRNGQQVEVYYILRKKR